MGVSPFNPGFYYPVIRGLGRAGRKAGGGGSDEKESTDMTAILALMLFTLFLLIALLAVIVTDMHWTTVTSDDTYVASVTEIHSHRPKASKRSEVYVFSGKTDDGTEFQSYSYYPSAGEKLAVGNKVEIRIVKTVSRIFGQHQERIYIQVIQT